MMFLLNELSIHNQYQSESDFIASLKVVLGCRDLLRKYQRSLHCGRGTLGNRQVIQNNLFRKVVGNIANKDIQRAVLIWIDRDGPFWDDDKLHNPDEYFSDTVKGDVVTDTVLAEAAFRMSQKMDASVVSFSPSDYLFSPVVIKWYRNADDVLDLSIANYWQIQLLNDLLVTLQPPIQSWGQFIAYAKLQFENLIFLPSFESRLKGQPFNHIVADQALFLLSVINEIKTCFDDTGRRTKKGDEFVASYFMGDRARFSDESPTNKIKFSKELTFKKEDGTGVLCSFHGKISHGYYRLHISSPITKNNPLYVAYLGPKITKD